MDKTSKIFVIAGGLSDEREVSLRSGNNVHEALVKQGYQAAKLFDFNSLDSLKQLIELKQNSQIDLAVLMTHGDYGEDGRLQGFLEICGIPYTGSDVRTSALCMDKIRTKEILRLHNLPVLNTYKVEDFLNENFELKSDLPQLRHGKIIMKKRCGGSSIGVYKFESVNDLSKFCKQNSSQDFEEYLIEDYLQGTELTASVIPVKTQLKALPLLEIRPKNEFYDYEAKYTEGMTDFILPAEISAELTKQIQDYALKAYTALGCKGAARIDFKLSQDMQAFILEANTLPGMTNTSDLPQQAQQAGISFEDLVEIIVSQAEAKQVSGFAKMA